MKYISRKNYIILDTNKAETQASNFAMNEHNRLLFKISNALLKLDEPSKILQKSVDATKEAMNAYTVSIALYDKTSKKLVIEIINRDDGYSRPINTKEFKMGEGVTGLAAQLRKIITIPDIRKSSLFINKNKKNNFGGIIAIPMILNGELIGVLNISSKEPRVFSLREAEFLTVLSTIIAGSIKNNNLYRQLDNQVKNLSKLFGITSITNQQVKSTVSGIVNSLPPLLESEAAHFLFFNKETGKLNFYSSSSKSDENLPAKYRTISLKRSSVSSTVFKTEKPILINNAAKSALIDKRYKKIFGIDKQISVPVMIKDKCFGVIHILNKKSGDFTNDDIKLASIVATRIASKIENAELLENLNTEKGLLNNIVQNTNDGIAVLDENNKIIIWNKYLENLVGVRARDIIGLHHIEAIKKSSFLEKDKQNIERAINFLLEKRGVSVDLQLQKNEEACWIRVSSSHIFDEDDAKTKTIFVIRDISADKELLQAKNDFISTSTHELRTPLTAIKGYLSMMKNGDVGEFLPKQTEYLDKTYSATARLVQLVEDLLSVLRINENRIDFNFENFNINQLIRQSISSLKIKALAKKIKIDFIPKIEFLYCHADIEKTRKILENLIDNAIKYSAEGRTILITSDKQADDEIKIAVKDQGVGISIKDQIRIFDKFTRAPNQYSIQAGGTGLGLFIAKTLAEKQRGSISVKSQLKHGSIFCLTLPVAK